MAVSGDLERRWVVGGRLASLFDEDPDLVSGMEAPAGMHSAHLVVWIQELPAGAWHPPSPDSEELTFGMLVTRGWLLRRTQLDGGTGAELFGPGDVLWPWRPHAAEDDIPAAVWRVLSHADVAVLDRHFAGWAAAHPQVLAGLLDRVAAHGRTVALQMTLAGRRKLDPRLEQLLWHLALRWGRVTPRGLHLPAPLSHGVLAEMVGARRASVTVALARLASSIERLGDGSWLLTREPASGASLLTGAALDRLAG